MDSEFKQSAQSSPAVSEQKAAIILPKLNLRDTLVNEELDEKLIQPVRKIKPKKKSPSPSKKEEYVHTMDPRRAKILQYREERQNEDALVQQCRKINFIDDSMRTLGLVSPKMLKKFKIDIETISPKVDI